MSQGTLFGDFQCKAVLPICIIKAYSLDISVEMAGSKAEFNAFSKQRIPSFIGQQGFRLQESVAIIYYCMCCYFHFINIIERSALKVFEVFYRFAL